MIRVYTQPACQPCTLTKRFLTKRGIEFEEIPLASVTAEQIEAWKVEGLLAAPIVVTPDGQAWSGFRHDRLSALA